MLEWTPFASTDFPLCGQNSLNNRDPFTDPPLDPPLSILSCIGWLSAHRGHQIYIQVEGTGQDSL